MSETQKTGAEQAPASPDPEQGKTQPVDQKVQEEAGQEREKSNYD